MGRLLGREHASTPQSGVEAPRLSNGASPDCIIVVVVVVVVVFVVVVFVVMEMTFTYVSVHTRALQKGARLPTNQCIYGGLTPGSKTPGVSATPREPSMT